MFTQLWIEYDALLYRSQRISENTRFCYQTKGRSATQGHSRPLKLWLALSGLEWPIALSGLEWPIALSGLEWPILPFANSTRIANPLLRWWPTGTPGDWGSREQGAAGRDGVPWPDRSELLVRKKYDKIGSCHHDISWFIMNLHFLLPKTQHFWAAPI